MCWILSDEKFNMSFRCSFPTRMGSAIKEVIGFSYEVIPRHGSTAVVSPLEAEAVSGVRRSKNFPRS